MSVPKRRWVEGFSKADGTGLLAFSRLSHEWTPSQPLDVPIESVVGADYGINLLGGGPMPKRPGRERVRFLVRHADGGESIDEQVDTLSAALRRYGLGRLWQVVEGYGSQQRRWAYAQVVAMPDMTYGVRDREYVPVSIEFVRLSDWHAEAETVETLAVGASPAVMEVVNAGTADARDLTVELASESASGYVNPTIKNTTTSEWVALALTGATASHRLRVDTGRAAVEQSTDAGVTWASAYTALSMGATQSGLLTLVPGSNYIEITADGMPDMTATARFYAPFE